MLLIRKKIVLALDLSFNMISNIGWINILLANMNEMLSIVDVDYISLKILLVITLILSSSLLLILI